MKAVEHPVAGVDYPSTFQALDEWFRDEVACRAYIRRLRWPTGFCCPDCGVVGEPWEMAGGWLRCRACRRETSITAGTIFEGTRKPLRTWFLAMWFVTSQKNGMSALELQRQMGFGSYQTAWAWLHKIRKAMVRPGRGRLAGGSRPTRPGRRCRAGQARPCGRAGKTVVAVAAGTARAWPRLAAAAAARPDASAESLEAFLAGNVAPPAAVHTDGWQGYAGLPAAGYDHQADQLSRGWERGARGPARDPPRLRPRQALAARHPSRAAPAKASPGLPRRVRLPLVWGFGCQALNVGIVFLPVSSSSRWRQPSRGLVHDVPRGARPLARIIAPQACIRWTRGDPDHDAAMRIGGEAPGRRAHSSTRHESHRKARVTATSDRHRQPAGEPWADRETVSGAPLRPSPLTPPDAGRHRPASRRWSPNATAR